MVSIILVVGLVTNSSFFSQAVDRTILTQNLTDFSKTTGRPPFSTSVYFFPSQDRPVSLVDAENLTNTVTSIMTGNIGLPPSGAPGLPRFPSGGLLLQPEKNSTEYSANASGFLDASEVVYIAGVESHIQMVDGEAFTENGASKNEVADVWIHDLPKIGRRYRRNLQRGHVAGHNLGQGAPGRFLAFHQPDSNFWFNDPD